MKAFTSNKDDYWYYSIYNTSSDISDDFIYLATTSLLIQHDSIVERIKCSSYSLKNENDFRFLGNFLTPLNFEEQLGLIKCATIALHQKGFARENLYLEEILFLSMQCNLECLIDINEDSYDALLWKKTLNAGTLKECLENIDEIFCDLDFELFIPTVDSIFNAKIELKAYADIDPMSYISDYGRYVDHQASKFIEVKEFNKKIIESNSINKYKKENGYVYCIGESNGHYKIGLTKSSPIKRLKELQTSNPKILGLMFSIQHESYKLIEQQIHNKLKQYRVCGEWFDCCIDIIRNEFLNIQGALFIDNFSSNNIAK